MDCKIEMKMLFNVRIKLKLICNLTGGYNCNFKVYCEFNPIFCNLYRQSRLKVLG